VLDATTGQNGIAQAERFHAAIELTGLVLTKLDGTAKGGVILSIRESLGLPILFVGVGESAEDLHAFSAEEFVEALFSE
jgi:fused signal recognition particle receptor